MNLDYILEQIQLQIQSGMTVLTDKGKELASVDMITLAVIAAVGLLFCFLGLKIVRFWAAVFGLMVGFAGGAYLSSYFGLTGYVPLIIGGVAGVILAVLGAVFYHAGAFLVGWLLGIAGSAYFIRPADWMFALVCVGIGLVIALLTLKLAEPVIALVTALLGGAAAGQAGYIFLPVKNQIIQIAMIVVLVILGLIVQLLLESKKRKRLHLEKADEIRRNTSVANEVDRARAIMEDLDKGKDGVMEFEDLDEGDDGNRESEDLDEEYMEEDVEDLEEDDDIQILNLDDDDE